MRRFGESFAIPAGSRHVFVTLTGCLRGNRPRRAWRNFPANADAARIYTARNAAARPWRRGRHARHGTCGRQFVTDALPVT
ncbi:hypothetical protein WT63_29975 [Burkholderia anthina]|nr:hypothetical protein WT63_29975 [Burkholderia anthina]